MDIRSLSESYERVLKELDQQLQNEHITKTDYDRELLKLSIRAQTESANLQNEHLSAVRDESRKMADSVEARHLLEEERFRKSEEQRHKEMIVQTERERKAEEQKHTDRESIKRLSEIADRVRSVEKKGFSDWLFDAEEEIRNETSNLVARIQSPEANAQASLIRNQLLEKISPLKPSESLNFLYELESEWGNLNDELKLEKQDLKDVISTLGDMMEKVCPRKGLTSLLIEKKRLEDQVTEFSGFFGWRKIDIGLINPFNWSSWPKWIFMYFFVISILTILRYQLSLILPFYVLVLTLFRVWKKHRIISDATRRINELPRKINETKRLIATWEDKERAFLWKIKITEDNLKQKTSSITEKMDSINVKINAQPVMEEIRQVRSILGF